MTLEAGSRLGAYEIVGALGSGGMGEVYRARDPQLGRDVAIKVLPETVADDPERLSRFEREARTLAALNHPNVATLFGMERAAGAPFLVMEVVEGPTLQDRLAQGPMPPQEAIAVFLQVAEALEAAHEAGIVHRDLKPANVKLAPGGSASESRVKVLDFGLAKAFEAGDPTASPAASPAASASPTLTLAATVQGVILGTAAYMAPEQARGLPVDKRADIWAFGACLWEALTGERLFAGEDASITLAAVLRDEPDLDRLPPQVPPHLRTLLERCLRKEPRRRLRDIGDARIALQEGEPAAGSAASETAGTLAPWRRALPWAVAAVAAASLAFALLRPGGSAPPATGETTRLSVTLPSDQPMILYQGGTIALSPDGRSLVVRVGSATDGRLLLRRLDRLDFEPISGLPAVTYDPFFSPDGKWLAFPPSGTTELLRVPMAGGSPLLLATLPNQVRGGAWLPDGRLVLGFFSDGLHILPATGGEPQRLTEPETAGEAGHMYPAAVGDGSHVLYDARSAEGPAVRILDLSTGDDRQLHHDGGRPFFVAPDLVVFTREGGSLWAARLDAGRESFVAEPVRVLEGIVDLAFGLPQVTVSAGGTLAYFRAGGETAAARSRLVLVDRAGRETAFEGGPVGAFEWPRLSPDGGYVTFMDPRDFDIYVADLERGTTSRLTFDGRSRNPVWTSDGSAVVLRRDNGIFQVSSSGAGSPRTLLESSEILIPVSFTPDGSYLLVSGLFGGRRGIATLPAEGGDLTPLALGASSINRAQVSPDGRWIAYQSAETSPEGVFLRPFPDVEAGKWQVSDANGGFSPVWAPRGDELFYRTTSGRMMRAAVAGDEVPELGRPEVLFDDPYPTGLGRQYDVMPDGEHFLMRDSEGWAGGELVVVLGWREELLRLLGEAPG